MFRFIPLETFEHDVHAILAADSDGIVRFCNNAAGALLGCDPQLAVGRPCWRTARLRTLDGRPFCSRICPVQRQASSARLAPLHRVVSCPLGFRPVSIEMLTFIVPAETNHRRGVVHMLRQAPHSPGWVAAGPALQSSICRSHVGSLSRLSPREAAILRLLAAGLGSSAIAARLALSPFTVRNHIASILRKLGVHRRLEAVLALVGRS